MDVSPLGTTDSTHGDATGFTDSTLTDADADTDKLGRPFVRIDEKVGSGPSSGEISRVKDGGLTVATGAVTVSPNFSAAVESGADYSLWWACHPKTAERAINKALRQLRRKVVTPITIVTNGDFEDVTSGSGVDSWTYTNCTTSGTNGYSSTAGRVRHGTYAARLQASGGAPRLESTAIRVVENDTLVVAAWGMADVGVVELVAYDSTNAAEIGTNATHNEEAYMMMRVWDATIPSGCEEFTVRLEGTGASDDLYFDNVIVWPYLRRWYEPPSWLEDPADKVSIGYYHQGRALVGTNSYTIDEGEWETWEWSPRDQVDEAGSVPFRVELATPVTEPLFMQATRPFAELSADSDTTTADRELVVQLALGYIRDGLVEGATEEAQGEQAQLWRDRKAEADLRATQRMNRTRHGDQRMRVRAPRMRKYR